jgi:alanine racemase
LNEGSSSASGVELPSPAEETASAILTIDLGAIVANYRRLCILSAPAECAAVVKADAYGLGMQQVAPVLSEAGCETFFVATPAEAVDLRVCLPNATIYVFDGLMPGTADLYRQNGLRPILNSLEEVMEWAVFCRASAAKLPAALHLDTGMNRLGLSAVDAERLASSRDLFGQFDLSLIVSHLACADQPGHPKSAAQQRLFDEARRKLPQAKASLANSAGILLGTRFHYDLVRPGIALYGGKPRQDEGPFPPVVTLSARVLQIHEGLKGETVGYGATRTLKRPSRIATLAVGYADGLFRALSAGDGKEGLHVHFGEHPAPILGRVSMDLITVDVTDVPAELARRGGFAEVMGKNAAHTVAEHAGTIDYEILTNLGKRALRRYIGV